MLYGGGGKSGGGSHGDTFKTSVTDTIVAEVQMSLEDIGVSCSLVMRHRWKICSR